MYFDRLIVLAIGGYAILDAVRRRYLPLQREIYLALFLLLVLLLIVHLIRAGKVQLTPTQFGVGLVVLLAPVIAPVFGLHFDPVYFVGDLVIVLFLITLLIVGKTFPDVFWRRSNHLLLLGLLCVAMILAPLVQAVAPTNDQFAPPHMLLMAATWAGLACTGSGKARILLMALLLLELTIAYSSGQRTNVLLWLGYGALAIVVTSSSRRLVAIGAMFVLAGIIAIGPGNEISSQLITRVSASVIEESRFGELQEGPDASLLGRYLEVEDVWQNIEDDWTPVTWIFGVGHGATYRPYFWYPERNMKNGRTHNIHFGPMLVLYRYGLIGLALYLWCCIAVAGSILKTRISRRDDWNSWWALTVRMASVGALLTFFFFNALQDPVVAYTIAAFVGLSANRFTSEPSVDGRRYANA